MTTWSALLGDEDRDEEQAAEPGFFGRLRDSLGKSRRALTGQLAAAAFDPTDDEAWERLEEALIAADVGVPATAELVQRLEARGVAGDLTEPLVEEASSMLGEPATLSVREQPSVLLVVGVNGTGKTTTIGKLAYHLNEHGIEVELRPAGKKITRLSLLSGGEKALAAIAFLFAVFLARPSPFYLLDEVEAALDDANISRFVELLRRFSDRAQFVVITHQKRTMEAADTLYGVSMGDDGVSKVVSRRLPREVAERDEASASAA